MIKKINITSLIIGLFFTAQGQQIKQAWTSADPLSIPNDIRTAAYKKGNLVANSSFEHSSVQGYDSINKPYSLENWEVIGKGVQLVDVATGNRAIKISKTETEVDDITRQSAGVLSDYIPVIPANYDLFFDIKLENIVPSSTNDRFQNRINKDIDIHLVFYNENKEELDPGIYFEFMSKNIDNSFKGFGFSNYYYIDHFDWARVHGRAWEYPFSEGDLPDGCRYVRIFAGLKCSGAMWIDNIDFRLSKWSFTAKERIDSIFDKTYDLADLLIPTPRKVSNKNRVPLKNKTIKIINEGNASAELKASVKLLQDRFNKSDNTKALFVNPDARTAKDIAIILLKPSTVSAVRFKEAFKEIANKDQGYFIRKIDNNIFLGANTDIGIFYATTTLCQLINDTDKVMEYADITDYPDFVGRSVRLLNYETDWSIANNKSLSETEKQSIILKRNSDLDRQLNDVDFYAFYKINKLYNEYHQLSSRWWEKDEFFNKLYKTVGSRCDLYGEAIRPAVMFNPYIHLGQETPEKSLTDSLRNIFSHSSDESMEKIKNLLRPALEAGAKTVMFCADDFVPHSGLRGEYTLYNAVDRGRFANLADAQNFLIKKLRTWLDEAYKNIRLEFVPAPYNNRFIDYGRGTADTYFRDLATHLDSSVAVIWTGNTVRSLYYDKADMQRANAVYRVKPMLWDNTPYARTVETKNGGYTINYPEKSVLCNLFEPYDVYYSVDFLDYVDTHFYNNQGGFGEINKIQYLTFADFSWNTKDYNPEHSLYKALVQTVGKNHAKLLLAFNDSYFKFVASWSRLRTDKLHNGSYQFLPATKERDLQRMKAMEKAFEALAPIKNDQLKKELKNEMDKKIHSWKELAQY